MGARALVAAAACLFGVWSCAAETRNGAADAAADPRRHCEALGENACEADPRCEALRPVRRSGQDPAGATVFVACVAKANCNPPVTCAARPGEAGSWCYIFSDACVPADWTAISCASFDCGIR